MKRVFNENKVLFLLIVIIIICVVVSGIALVKYFYSGNKDKYGNRLEGISEYPRSDKIGEDIAKLFNETETFNSVKVNLKGKLIYINIDLKEGVSLADAQTLALKSLEAFSDEEKSFYDIQLIVTTKDSEEENTLYPLMAYKNSNSTQVVWTHTN